MGRDRSISPGQAGGFSRREVHAGLAGLSLFAAGAGTARRAAGQSPQKGGHLRVAVSDTNPSDTIDPAVQLNWVDLARCQQLYGRLIDFLPDKGLVPGLATSWETKGDASVWVLALREGVEFHNGKTMTSADVVYSLQRLMDPNVGSSAAAHMREVTAIEADGPGAVVLTLASPNADIPYLLTQYNFVVVPEGASNFPADATGTGPWKVKEFEPGIGSVFERHPNYWRDGLPYIDSVETFGIPDDNARLNALLSDEIDLMQKLDPTLVATAQERAEIVVLEVAGPAHVTYPMRADTAPFSDNNVRLALKHAFDRQRFLDLAFQGHGTVGRDHPIPPFDPFHCDDIPVPAHDPDKTMFLLKEAGQADAVFELYASDANFGGVNASLALAELMRETGVDVRVKRTPADAYWSNVWMQVPWCASNWGGSPTADMMLSVGYTSDASWNESYWHNETFDRLLVEARGETDTERRKQLYCDMQWMLHDEGASIVPLFANWIDAYNRRVKGLVGHPRMFLGSMYWDEVWMESA